MKSWTRKDFLKASLLTSGAALLASQRTFAVNAPGRSANGDVRVAVVGLGGRGYGHISWFNSTPGVRVVALCEVDQTRLAKGVKRCADEYNTKVTTYRDYRKLLEDPSIDVVVIATPNYWHALMTIWACQAGKDVYVEKPVSHNIWEGRKSVEAARKYKRVVQAGMQSRSAVELSEAFAYLQEGHLGAIKYARGICYKARQSIGHVSGPQPIPEGVDYDLWCGPTELKPLRRKHLHYDWHWFWETGNAEIGNQGIHQLDLCRMALGHDEFPPAVMSFGGRFGPDDDATTPNTHISILDYKPAPLIFEVRALPMRAGLKAMDAYRGTRVGIVIQCEHGYYSAGATGGGHVYDNSGKRIRSFAGPGGSPHVSNFIAAVHSRKVGELNADIELGHLSSGSCHLANISYRLGQEKSLETLREGVREDPLTKDACERLLDHLKANDVPMAAPVVQGPWLRPVPGAETFVTAEKYDVGYWGNQLLRGRYRHPFVVPEKV